jgi:hypothetical protein
LDWVSAALIAPPSRIKAKKLRSHCAVLIIIEHIAAVQAIRSTSRSSCIHVDELKCGDSSGSVGANLNPMTSQCRECVVA